MSKEAAGEQPPRLLPAFYSLGCDDHGQGIFLKCLWARLKHHDHLRMFYVIMKSHLREMKALYCSSELVSLLMSRLVKKTKKISNSEMNR